MKKKMPGVPAPPDPDNSQNEPAYQQSDFTQPITDQPQGMGSVIRRLHANVKRSIRPNPRRNTQV